MPDDERHARLTDFIRIAWGGLNSLATAVLGAFPILFGLSFWQALTATILGVVSGAIVLAPMALFGPVNGTNNAVSSGAHFGVVGRIVGSFLSLLTAVAFFCISVWSSGDALVGAARRLFGWPASDALSAIAYALFALAVLIVCIYGFQFMLLISKVAVVASSVLFAVGLLAFWRDFDPGFAGEHLAWSQPAFWPPFISAALVVFANPISFGAFLGDWTRYLPRGTSRRALLGASILAQLLSLLPFLFGLVTASIIATRAPQYLQRVDYTGGLLAVTPAWFFAPLLLLALLSGMSTGTTSLYGTGLDFSSVFPRLSRPRATLWIGIASSAFIFVGRFYFNLFDTISTFISLIIVTTTPWIVVLEIGYVVRRGHYLPEALQVFNRGQRGGPYWFSGGWNLAGISAWLGSALLALMTVNIPGHFVGPLGHLADEVDISILVALLAPALLYPSLLWLLPDPQAVYGARGPRWMRAPDTPVAPITPL